MSLLPAPRRHVSLNTPLQTVGGVAILLSSFGRLDPVAHATQCDGNWLSHTQVTDIKLAAQDGTTIWFGSFNGGIFEWDTTTNTGRAYTFNEHCLPSNSIEDIAVDVNGNVWAATFRGLARRPAGNGPNDPWDTFDSSNSGLTDDAVTAVAAEPTGGVWVGTFEGGLFFFDGINWTNFNTANSPLGDNFVTSLAVDPAGNKWIGTFGNFVYRFDGVSTWTNFDALATGSPGGCNMASLPPEDIGLISTFVKVLGVDPVTGDVWFDNIDDGFCSLNGTTRFDGADWDAFTPLNSNIAFRTEGIGVTVAGDIWFASRNGIQRFDGGAFTPFPPPSAPESALSVTPVGASVWFGTPFGPFDFTAGRFNSHEPKTLVSGQANDIVFRDLGGGQIEVWAATDAALQRYDGQRWFALTPQNSPLVTSSVYSLAVDTDDSLWIGASAGGTGVQHVVNDTWTTFTPQNSGLISTAVSDIAVDPTNGEKWFGDRFSAGLASFNGTTWSTFTPNGAPFSCNVPNGVPGRSVTDIEIDGNGVKWIGSSCGLTRMSGGVWTTFDTGDGLASNNVRDVALDASGNVWVATSSGVSRFNGSSFTSWFPGRNISTIEVDLNGIVWATLTDVGAAAYNGTNWVMLAVSDGLLNERTPLSTAVHPNGHVWFGTQIGISIYTQQTPIVFGDIDLDGDVDVDDAAALAATLVDQPVSQGQLMRSDLNFDGMRNASDIQTFLDILFPPD